MRYDLFVMRNIDKIENNTVAQAVTTSLAVLVLAICTKNSLYYDYSFLKTKLVFINYFGGIGILIHQSSE